MDDNIRLMRFDENGIGYFIEYDLESIDTRTKVKRRIQIPLSNFQKNGYSCKNFSIDKNGKCKFNNTTYANLSDMFNDIPISDRKRINGRNENEVTTIASIKMMVEAAASTGNVKRIKVRSDKYVYALPMPMGRNERGEERPADMLLFIPEDVKEADYYHWQLGGPSATIFDPTVKYGTVRIVGGGPSLTIIGGIMKGITAETLDVSMLYKDRLLSVANMFENCSFDNLDLSWLPNCKKIKSVASMFNEYRGKLIDLAGFTGSKVVYTVSMFANTSAEIRGLKYFTGGRIETLGAMFENYTNKDMVLDLRNLNTSNAISASKMFSGCVVKELNVTGWDTTRLKDTTSMFESATMILKGLGAADIRQEADWNLNNLNIAPKMFKNGTFIAEWDTYGRRTYADIKIRSNFGKISHAEEMFMEAKVGTLDISEMRYAGEGCADIFMFMIAADIKGPDINEVSPYTKRLLIDLNKRRGRQIK